jgi:heparan sulfate N-deacetylase/N-sulfotransferase NDST2
MFVTDLCVVRYKVEVSGKSLPVLTNLDKGKYAVIVFENLNKYLQMDKWNRELLDKYCREYSVGIVGFNPPSEETLVGAQLRGFPLFIHTKLKLKVSLLSAYVCMFIVYCSEKRGVRLAAVVRCKG